MPNYRRNYVPGGTYFFTVATAGRRPILTTELARRSLRAAIHKVRDRFPFNQIAIVLLPDHLYCVWSLPENDANFSTRWRRVKEEFTREFLSQGGQEAFVSQSRHSKGERGIWQRRFWEHTIRDEDDLSRCVDYCHWYPCKHRLVSRVKDWQWSTFHQFVRDGDYEENWGGIDPCPGFDTPEWIGD